MNSAITIGKTQNVEAHKMWNQGGNKLKTAIITGATSGIGKEIARSLANLDYHVILACRNCELANLVKEEFLATCPAASIEVSPPMNCAEVLSIKDFVDGLGNRKVDLLINNAGGNFITPTFTNEKIGIVTQVNYVAPYLLSRMLVPNLLLGEQPGRIINVSSVTHRIGRVNLPDFFETWREGNYPNTKLALVLFTYEFNKRHGKQGIKCCAVDPGAGKTKIFDNIKNFTPAMGWVIDKFYAPPEDCAKTVVHAATTNLLGSYNGTIKSRDSKKSDDRRNFYFFARGSFASCIVTAFPDPEKFPSFLKKPISNIYGLLLLFHSLIDYPIRNLTGGLICGRTSKVRSSKKSYDMEKAKSLWEATENYFPFLKNY